MLAMLLLQDIDISERISQAPKQRISIYCIAESLDRKLLEKRLEARGPSWLVSKYPDVLYGQYTSLENPNPTGVSASARTCCTLGRFFLQLSWLMCRTSFDTLLLVQSVFYFDYGCVSFWNLTPKQVTSVDMCYLGLLCMLLCGMTYMHECQSVLYVYGYGSSPMM